MKNYVSINVWVRRSSTRLICYRCLQILPDGGYCVQGADFFDAPIDESRLLQSLKQFLELLAEDPPEERAVVFGSIEEAIEDHQRSFAWADSEYEIDPSGD